MSSYTFVDGIEYIPFNNIKSGVYFNYQLQQDAGLGICKKSFEENESHYVMCFGHPGTGKSTFAKQLALELGKNNVKPNLLIISCNTVLSRAVDIRSVIEDLNKTIKIAEKHRPLIYVLDEFDAITQQRLLSTKRENVNEFTQWFMDTFGNNFSPVIKKEGKVVVFAFTNDILNIDGAVRRRFGTLFHFDLPSDDVLISMLDHNKISPSGEILTRFKEMLYDSKIDGASFMRSCEKSAKEIIAKSLPAGEAARTLVAHIGANIITEQQQRAYVSNLAPFINAANEAMRYWRDKK